MHKKSRIPREKGSLRLPLDDGFGRLPSLFFSDSEHFSQNRSKQGGGAQDDDLHLDTLLSVCIGTGIVIICNNGGFGSGVKR